MADRIRGISVRLQSLELGAPKPTDLAASAHGRVSRPTTEDDGATALHRRRQHIIRSAGLDRLREKANLPLETTGQEMN